MNRKKPRIILINPWVYDFSAMNLWSMPLGLLKTAEHLSRLDIDLLYIDCTGEIRAERKFGTGKYPRQVIKKPGILRDVPRTYARYGITLEQFAERFSSCLPCDMVLVTSIMTYWYPGVQKVIDMVKRIAPDVPVILGGIYATLCYDHAVEHAGADSVFPGQVEDGPSDRLREVMERYGLRLNRTGQTIPYHKLALYRAHPFAAVLTSRGCPNRCSYCASSLLSNGFFQRDPSAVIEEIIQHHDGGVSDFAFYDDALLVNADSHIKVILKEVISSATGVRFHCPNGIHARYIDDELAYLMKKSGFTTLRLSLETANADRQRKTGGKVTSGELREAVGILKRHGFEKGNIGVYIMYGLPGQSLREVQESISFVKGLGVRINLTEFSPLPGTDCWNDLKDRGIIQNDLDPLLTNNSVYSLLFSVYGIRNIDALKLSVQAYNAQE